MNGKPNENKIKEAFDQIELPEGAQERMYQNILKKAEAARSHAEPSNAEVLDFETKTVEIHEPPVKKKFTRNAWRKYAAIAACLVVFIVAGAFLPTTSDDEPTPTVPVDPPSVSEPIADDDDPPLTSESPLTSQPPAASKPSDESKPPAESKPPLTSENPSDGDSLTQMPYPFIDVSGPQDFEAQLGFSINAPDGAEDASFCIAYENTAIVTFTWNGHSYDYSASEDAKNLSDDDAADGILSESWQTDDLSFCLVNTDGASQSEFDELVETLKTL